MAKEISVGRPSKFRGKNRTKPIQVYLTDDGLAFRKVNFCVVVRQQ